MVLTKPLRIAKVLSEQISEQVYKWRWLLGPTVQNGKNFLHGKAEALEVSTAICPVLAREAPSGWP